jgi:polyphosphate kinase
MAFNQRVLEEALDESNPLLERVKFLAITASNLDEFVEVRLAGLLQQVEQGNPLTGPDGVSPTHQLQRLAQELHRFVEAQYGCWNQQLLPALRREGIRILSVASLDRGAATPWICFSPAASTPFSRRSPSIRRTRFPTC